nr:MAG TPA: hypothetical protein [Caudoviricetes sp.]
MGINKQPSFVSRFSFPTISLRKKLSIPGISFMFPQYRS